MLRDSSAPTDPASGVLTSDHPRPDTDPPDPGHLHDPPHSPSAMDISLPDFPALTLNPAPPGMPPGMHAKSPPAKSPPTKQRSPTIVRKPLTVQRLATTTNSKPTLLPTRRNSSLSSVRFAPFSRQSSRSTKSRHSAVVVVETDDPTTPGCVSLAEPIHTAHVIINPLFGAVMPPNLEDKHTDSQALLTIIAPTLDEGLSMAQLPTQDYKPTLLGLVEPRISGDQADLVISMLGYLCSYRIEGSGFSGGIWLCWNDSVHVEILFHHFQFLHSRVSCNKTGSSVLLTLVYASSSTVKHFTWLRGATFARLDRFLCNSLWGECHSESTVSHVFRMKSDHRPILLHIGNVRNVAPSRQFKYLSGWRAHPDWIRMI
ncbi:hypothetical protein V6N13_088096 [Hibiscus sabdariffa]